MYKFPINKKKLNTKDFCDGYISTLVDTLSGLCFKKIETIKNILKRTIMNQKKILVAGNGGSASIANHFLCDYNKGIKLSSGMKLSPKVISLSSASEIITAIANDINFDQVFVSQAQNYLENGDVVVLFSSSGKSKNILNMIKFCKKKKVKIIFITGFLSKKLRNSCKVDVHLDLNCKNYGITEDIFSSIMHMISQSIRFEFKKNEVL